MQLVGVHTSGQSRAVNTFPPLAAGELRIPLQLQATTATALIALVVAIVGWAVQAFAGWYLREDDRYGIFAATVSLFTAAMLLVVAVRRPRAHPGRLGGDGLVLLPAHRPLEPQGVRAPGGAQGLPRHPAG